MPSRRQKHPEESLHTVSSCHVPHSCLWANWQSCRLRGSNSGQQFRAYSNLPREAQILVSSTKKAHYPWRSKTTEKGKHRKMSIRPQVCPSEVRNLVSSLIALHTTHSQLIPELTPRTGLATFSTYSNDLFFTFFVGGLSLLLCNGQMKMKMCPWSSFMEPSEETKKME